MKKKTNRKKPSAVDSDEIEYDYEVDSQDALSINSINSKKPPPKITMD